MSITTSMFYDKITLLNETIVECLNETDEKKVIKAFTELGVKILEADFGFVWFNSQTSSAFELVYTSPNIPYTPKLPRKGGRNYHAIESLTPEYVSQIKKRTDRYDVSPYMKSFVIIPISHREKIYGNIVLCFKKREIFPKEKKILCSFIGHGVAQAITIHRLLANEHESRILAQHNEARFRALLENSYEIIMLVNKAGKIASASPAFAKIFGKEVGNPAGQNILDIIYKEDVKSIEIYLQKINEHSQTVHITEFRYVHTDGSICFLESTGTNLLSAPSVKNIVLNIRDITERKQAEKAIERERLLEQERSKTAFIAEATHELRTPLAIIKGNVDLALQKKTAKTKNVRTREDVATFRAINHEVNHISELVSDLAILVGQDNTSWRKIASHDIHLDKLVGHAAKRCETLARKKHISIRVQRLPDTLISGDEPYLDKLFTNLIKNGILYGKEKGSVTISGVEEEKIIHIEVTDNGIGIPARDLPHVFERFYRSEKAREVNHDGTGLGLAIVRWIADAHGGAVTVRSSENKGTTFRVSLPKLMPR